MWRVGLMRYWFSGWRILIWVIVGIWLLVLVMSQTLTGGSQNERKPSPVIGV